MADRAAPQRRPACPAAHPPPRTADRFPDFAHLDLEEGYEWPVPRRRGGPTEGRPPAAERPAP